MQPTNTITAAELDARFDAGLSVLEFFDAASVQSATLSQKKLTLEMPLWMINSLDDEAQRLGIARNAVIKTWIADKLQHRNPPL